MPDLVRAALGQPRWTASEDSAVATGADVARRASVQAAKVLCSQESLPGSEFCRHRIPGTSSWSNRLVAALPVNSLARWRARRRCCG